MDVIYHEHNDWMLIGRAYLDDKKSASYYVHRCQICYDEGREELISTTGVKSNHALNYAHKMRNLVSMNNPPRYGPNIINVRKKSIGITDGNLNVDISDATSGSLKCSVCDITLNSEKQMKRHLRGIKHKMRAQRSEQTYCNVCDLVLNSQNQMKEHLGGIKHKMRAQRTQWMEK